MTSPKSREEMAEEYAVHKLERKVQCAACGEETLWHVVAEDFLAGHASRDQEIAAKDTRIAELEAEVALDDKLIEDRNQVLEALECPVHGPCVPGALNQIKEMKALLAQAAEALQFYAGQAHDAHWDGCRFLAFDKFGCLDALASGPHVASQVLAALKAAGFGRNGQDGKGGGG